MNATLNIWHRSYPALVQQHRKQILAKHSAAVEALGSATVSSVSKWGDQSIPPCTFVLRSFFVRYFGEFGVCSKAFLWRRLEKDNLGE